MIEPMLLKKKTQPQPEENPYTWPESYYMEADPQKRLELLKNAEENNPRESFERLEKLFASRYHKQRKEYADRFMGAWMELLFLARSKSGAAGKWDRVDMHYPEKKIKKMLQAVHKDFALDREKDFGSDLLLKELQHMLAVYAAVSAQDRTYNTLIFHIGRIGDENLRKKLNEDYEKVQHLLLAAGAEDEFHLLDESIEHIKES